MQSGDNTQLVKTGQVGAQRNVTSVAKCLTHICIFEQKHPLTNLNKDTVVMYLQTNNWRA